MKHRKGFNRLARKPAHRLSLYRHMATALFRVISRDWMSLEMCSPISPMSSSSSSMISERRAMSSSLRTAKSEAFSSAGAALLPGGSSGMGGKFATSCVPSSFCMWTQEICSLCGSKEETIRISQGREAFTVSKMME